MILLSNEFWEIKNTKNKGRGVFACKEILKGTIIGDYIGKVMRPEEAIVDEENIYLMFYSDRVVISPDLKKTGAHLLNNSCNPNCWLYVYKGHTLAFARRNIKNGEELTIPYLLPPINDKFCNPCFHICKCADKNCLGTMHMQKVEYRRWRKITNKQAKETKKEKIKYGEELKELTDYPKRIQDSYIKEINKI